jgi:hypothetical protein
MLKSDSVDRDVNEVALHMADPFLGVDVKDRSWRLKTYKNCFIGKKKIIQLFYKYRCD